MSANKQIQISIPEPCHEPWLGMTKVDDLHRHCNTCNKVLTDFSGMSDTELVLWFTHSKGNLCGRFSPTQLNRALLLPTEKPEHQKPSGKKYWLNLLWLIPFSWGSKEAKAQTATPEVIRGKPPVSVITTTATDITPTAVKTAGPVKITGTVTAMEQNKKVKHAYISVTIAGNVIRTQTDTSGAYTLELPADSVTDVQISFWAHGFEGKVVTINRSEAINGQLVRDVKFDEYETMLEGKIMIKHEPVPNKKKNGK